MWRPVVAVLSLGVALAGCTTGSSSSVHDRDRVRPSAVVTPVPAVPTGPTTADRIACPAATVTVHDAKGLSNQLNRAGAGTVIGMTDGVYNSRFVLTASGTRARPIYVCGSSRAILDGGGVRGGYVLHLDHVAWVRLVGFTVRNGQKGVVADATQHSVIDGLHVHQIGDEAIHLRESSSDDVVSHNTIMGTGRRRAKFGEGVYVGTAESNWCKYSHCRPDPCNRDSVIGNLVTGTTAESVDIKEGTSQGIVAGNTFDGSALTAADSWVDVKGNSWLITGNTGTASPEDGFQTHQVAKGTGEGNVFSGNVAHVDGPGYAFHLTPVLTNQVRCDNRETGAKKGLTNTDCR